ncbi:MAG: hypothetical protein JWO08_3396, partial [Verrucomicrobiaceae bacterium]|nr:hypothetical protein [Verrucomicrobiaceae bacterium]
MQSSTSIVPAQPATLARVEPERYGEMLQPYSPPVAPPQPQPPAAYYYPPPVAAPPAPAENIISVADIIAYLRRFGKLACLLALPLAGLTFFYLGFGKKVYETESKLLIHIQATNPIQFAGNTNNGGMSELSAPMIINNHRTGLKTRRYTDYLFTKLPRAQLESFLEGQGKLGMKGRLMVALGLAAPPKAAMPEELFAQKIDLSARIEPVKDSHILRVIVRDSSPDSAAAMANAYVENYIHYVSDDALQSTKQNSEVLQRQGEEIMEKLGVAERKLQDYVKNADLIKLNAAGDMGTQRAESLTRAVTEADMDLLKATINLNSLRNAATKAEDAAGMKGVMDDPQLVELRKRLDEVHGKRTALDEWCGRMHPRVLALESDIRRLKEQIAKTTETRVAEILTTAEMEEKRLRSQDEQLRTQLSQARGAAFAEGTKQNTLSILSDEVSGLRDLYNQVTRSQKQSNIASSFTDNGQLTVADIAVTPDSPISPKKSIALIAGIMVFGLVGLGLPVTLGLAQDHLLPVMKGSMAEPATPQAAPAPQPMPTPVPQVSPFTPSAPPVSYLPPPPQAPMPQMPLRIPQTSTSATQILATLPELMSGEGPIQLGELLHPSPMSGGGAITQLIALLEKQTIFRNGPGIVFITSANTGEGKSLLSSALAASLCTTGRRVFLMECNPAAPSIQNWFPQAGGYSSWTDELETLRYGQSNLFLLPAHDLPSYEVSDLVDGYRAWIE